MNNSNLKPNQRNIYEEKSPEALCLDQEQELGV